MDRPQSHECPTYYHGYVAAVPDAPLVDTLTEQRGEVAALVRGLPHDSLRHRYAPEKWSVAEVIGHVNDTERIFATRALVFARGETAAYPGYDQDDFVTIGRFDDRSSTSLADEFEGLRAASIALFESFGADEWLRTGTASGGTFTVRALAHIMAGHVAHHRRVLSERYAL